MSAAELAGLIAAVAFVLLVGVLTVPLLKLGKVLDESRVVVKNVGDETVPLLREVTTTVSATNHQLEKVDVITTNVTSASANISGLTAVFAATLGTPAIKAAAFSYGVRRALSERNRAELERELRAGRRQARKARRSAHRPGTRVVRRRTEGGQG